MIEIEEDYVSFETAKLLKEKGFDAYIHLWYDENGEMFHKFHYEIKTNWRIRHGQEVYQCPTIQMAMKWLREVYKLSVRPRYDEVEDEKEHLHYAWFFDILSMNPYKTLVEPTQGYFSYEEACDMAIRYCLEHLI